MHYGKKEISSRLLASAQQLEDEALGPFFKNRKEMIKARHVKRKPNILLSGRFGGFVEMAVLRGLPVQIWRPGDESFKCRDF